MPSLSWFLHRQIASPGCSQQLANFCPPPILPPVSGSRSGRPSLHPVTPAVPPPVLGSGGSVNPDPLVSRLPSGSQVGAPLAPSLSGSVSSAGVSRSELLVRRLGRRLGGSLGFAHHFRPLEPRRTPTLHQRRGASGRA